jgi:hypothetical protein
MSEYLDELTRQVMNATQLGLRKGGPPAVDEAVSCDQRSDPANETEAAGQLEQPLLQDTR